VIENAFGILKQSFKELLDIMDLHVTFLHDVVVFCSLLYNMFLGQSPDEVARLLEVLQQEGALSEVDNDPLFDLQQEAVTNVEFSSAETKR
jgi:tellurite resistance protein